MSETKIKDDGMLKIKESSSIVKETFFYLARDSLMFSGSRSKERQEEVIKINLYHTGII